MMRIWLMLLLVSSGIHAEEVEQIKVGNFAVPTSQQPAPLFSFGQFIIDKHDVLGYNHIDYIKGKGKSSLANQLYFLYGLSDRATIAAVIPIPVVEKDAGVTTRGMGDIIIHGEYAYLNQETETYYNFATIVGNLYLPSGIAVSFVNPDEAPGTLSLGFGSPAFFVGGTFFHIDIDWYYFASVGELFTTTFNKNNKFGRSLWYQAGLGRNLRHMKDKLLILILECNGYKTNKDILHGTKDPDSGGNVIFLGPSLLFSTKRFIVQTGIQFPVLQKLNGHQTKDKFFFAFNIGWVFNHEEK